MSDCNQQCSSCSKSCSDRKEESLLAKPHPKSSIKKIIGILSGKGGVGKSLTTSMLAVALQREGYRVGILDADITGPSIGKIFGINEKAVGNETTIYPCKTSEGIDVISINMLLENDETPVLWRGPIIAGMVKQFYTDVLWQDIDFLLVDLPPGTSDVSLTIFQSLPLDGVVMVTTPQDLVKMIVAKTINMAKSMDIPILGLIENMSYIECEDCGHRIYPFGQSRIEEVAKEYDLKILAQNPINPEYAALCDSGQFEKADIQPIETAIEEIKKYLEAN